MAKKVAAKPSLVERADAVSDDLDADVFLYHGRIARGNVRTVEKMVLGRRHRENVVLILVTFGGDPDAAFRLARVFQDNYKAVIGFVSGMCKSAGTIAMQGANSLVWFPLGELGPLDIQIARSDDLDAMDSGLTATTALQLLGQESFRAFETAFLEIKSRSQGRISFKMATEIAANLTVGLFAPIYGQIQAMHLGEVGRANTIAALYGERLSERTKSLEPNAVFDLTYSYPSHSFVIDRAEAAKYFTNIREPKPGEQLLIDTLRDFAIDPQREAFYAQYLNTEQPAPQTRKGGQSGQAGKRPAAAKRPTRKSTGSSKNPRTTKRLLALAPTTNGRKR